MNLFIIIIIIIIILLLLQRGKTCPNLNSHIKVFIIFIYDEDDLKSKKVKLTMKKLHLVNYRKFLTDVRVYRTETTRTVRGKLQWCNNSWNAVHKTPDYLFWEPFEGHFGETYPCPVKYDTTLTACFLLLIPLFLYWPFCHSSYHAINLSDPLVNPILIGTWTGLNCGAGMILAHQWALSRNVLTRLLHLL